MNLDTYTTGIAGLIVAYAGIAVILLSIHIYSNWNPLVKGAVTVLGIVFCVVTYNSWPKIIGWPVATDTLPSRIYLLAIEIVEPDTIYLWARDLDQGLAFKRPRAYELPYSKLLHKQAEKARGRLKRGIAVIAEIDPTQGAPGEAVGDDAVIVKSNQIRFVDSPQGLLPQKE